MNNRNKNQRFGQSSNYQNNPKMRKIYKNNFSKNNSHTINKKVLNNKRYSLIFQY